MRKTQTKGREVVKQEKFSLTEIFAGCFVLILQMRKTSEYGDHGALRQRLRALLSKAERDAKDAGFKDEDIQMAIFAVVAFIDETIIASEWSQKEAWLTKPLQLELFDRFDAGEEFFVRLDRLRQHPQHNRSLLELYHLCMTLGIKGKYLLQEREKIRHIIEKTNAELRHAKGKSAEILSPHGRRDDEIVEVVKKEVPVWVIVISVVAIGFVFFLIMNFLISDTADTVVHLIESIK